MNHTTNSTTVEPVTPKGVALIVDDHAENLRTLKSILDEDGYQVFAAITGKLALNAVEKIHPDIILLDIMMPEINGYDVCIKLKNNPLTQDIPVLFISALDEPMDKVRAFEVGGIDYVSKPFDTNEILARVKTHVTLFRTQSQLKDAYVKLRNHTDELELKNNDLEAFSYSVSHDLRAPLRRIDGYCAAILDESFDVLDEQSQNFFNRIRSNTAHMGQLVDDLLELSRVSRSVVSRRPTNLSELSLGILQNIELHDEERHVEIKVDPNMTANCDSNLIDVLLTNLLDNAWKYTSKTRNASVEFGRKKEDNKDVFFVKDNGIGFNMQYAKRLFQPFQRMHNDSEFEGTGIGLATAHRVVKHHGGKIWADAAVDKGTTVFFTLE